MSKPAINWGNVCRVHAERLAELARENQEQAILFGNVSSHEASLLGRLRELERENAALRADKERLDWLARNRSVSSSERPLGVTPESLRVSIDAARKEAQP